MTCVSELRIDRRGGGIADLVIARPAKRNAMSYSMWSSVPGLCAELDADDSVKVVVLRGEGAHFCAGADIAEFGERRSTAENAREYGEQVEAAAAALGSLTKPTIAMVQGYCIGGGCELAVACDLRFAAASAEFAITPAKLGIVYAYSSTRTLVALTSPSFARYLLYSGNRVDAEHALRVGLVDELVEPDLLEKTTRDFAATIASRAQVSVRGASRMVEKIVSGLDVADDEAHDLPILAVDSEDYREGVAAFLAKRPPQFR